MSYVQQSSVLHHHVNILLFHFTLRASLNLLWVSSSCVQLQSGPPHEINVRGCSARKINTMGVLAYVCTPLDPTRFMLMYIYVDLSARYIFFFLDYVSHWHLHTWKHTLCFKAVFHVMHLISTTLSGVNCLESYGNHRWTLSTISQRNVSSCIGVWNQLML